MLRRYFPFLLGCLAALQLDGAIARRQGGDDAIFAFTAPVYNVSLGENARGTQFASCDDAVRMGVPLLHNEASVKFKIVEGDKNHLFKAHAKQIGDFVFLRIRQKDKNDVPLNRELRDHYEFVVKATCKRKDSGNLETTAKVRLRITDRNDASPMFTLEADRYEAEISEKILPFSNVLQVEASDADIGVNGQIYYSLVNHSSEFTVDPVSGWVKTLRPVRPGKYELQVRAEDRTSRLFYFDEDQIQPDWTSDVLITVTEAKKQQPKLLVEKRPIAPYSVQNDQLAAIIRVESAHEQTHVGLLEDDMRHWFILNQSDDHWELHTLGGQFIPPGTNVTVVAGSFAHGDTNTSAVIKIDFVEQHSIAFNRSKFELKVEENAPVAFVIARISALCSNPRDESVIRYHMESLDQNTTLPFRLSQKTGVLRVSRQLDYENKRKYEFTLFAKLDGLGEQASVTVEVAILDSNDHSPVFPAKWIRQAPISILPDTPLGTVLIKVTAVDQDVEDNGKISYKLATDANSPLSINISTGEILLLSPMPKGTDHWSAAVVAVDAGRPFSRSSALNLVFYRNGTKIPAKPRPIVVLEPGNLHSPVFTSTVQTVSVREDSPLGQVVANVSASDEDVGFAGLVRYTTWDEFFDVDPQTGEVRVGNDLTGRLTPGKESVEHEMEIIASDLGVPTKEAKMKIVMKVEDVNNHAPVFDRPWYRVRVAEDVAIGTTILKVSASDDDAGENGRIGYSLAATDSAVFGINENTGEVTLRAPLDREHMDVISYIVTAFDHGSPQKFSFVNVSVVVLDVNDNPPVCTQQTTKVRIPEDYPNSALVGCISATDADIGANSRVRYSILSDSNQLHPPFRVDHHSGCVFVNSPHRPLDYQLNTLYNLTIEVSDNGDTVLSTTCHFLVELIDVDENLHSPEFDDVAHEASVFENSAVGTEVYKVMASDPDRKDAPVDFSIVGGDGIGFFTVDGKGVIRTNAVLDREEKAKFWLVVEAADGAPQPRTAILHVFVRVLDKNDHRPMPVQPIYFASVKENSPQNTVVVKLEAHDADEAPDAVLNYRITKGDPQSFFRIDPSSGYITTSGSRKLDRETQKEHELWVSVCDNGEPQLCSDVVVVVSVEDLNDNAPVFPQGINHYSVPAGVTGIVCRIFAVDADAGANAQLYYNITDGDGRFSINEDGYVRANEPLAGDEVFPLNIQATDHGLPGKQSITRVVLTGMPRVTRQGPNRPPVLKGKGQKVPIHISDADHVGLTVAMLEAEDDDGDSLWWKIVDGNVNHTFALRPDTGALLLAKPLDQLSSNLNEITMTVKVTDGELEDTQKVTVKMARSPTKRPLFSAQHYRTQISEKTAIGTHVYTVKATNNDPASTKPIVYSVFLVEDVSMEEKLRIEPMSGNVVVMESADFEASREISLVVAARQGSLLNLATLTVGLTDDNDNTPVFLRKEMEVKVPLSTRVGSPVTTVLASDADSGANGIIKYSVVSGNEQGFFSLDASSGVLKLLRPLCDDYPEFILTVRATDGGKTLLTDIATVYLVTVADEEDQLKFSRPAYYQSIRETLPVGAVATVVSTEPSGRGLFSLQEPCQYFTIHPISGTVTLAKWLKRERSKTIECTVVARSSTGAVDTAKIIVKRIQANVHSPIFKQQVYKGLIRENAPAGTPVVTEENTPLIVAATDKDSGPNALVAYRSLNEDDPFFVVDLVSGAIRSRKPLDFEKMTEWSFYVKASDMGQPPRSSVPVLVQISIVDENDVTPKFTQSLYEEKIILPTVAGVVVARPMAEDGDTNGKLRFFLKNREMGNLFAVNATTGEVTVSAENSSAFTETSYKLEVMVTDGLHTDSSVVQLEVAASRKTGFRCAQPEYAVTVVENKTYSGSHYLTSLTALGAKEGSTIFYSLLSQDERFIVNQGTGSVYLAGEPFDREEKPVIRLLVEAKTVNKPAQIAHCVLVVNLEDVNDCAPQFLAEPYETVVSVDAKAGEKIFSIKAIDRDSGSNGMVHYSSSDIPKQFKLNKHDGKVTVAGPLESRKIYQFTVEATDRGTPSLKSSTLVRISVVEKARPLFSSNNYEAQVTKTAVIDTLVTSAKAVSNANGVLVYSLDDKSGLFRIDPDSGNVYLRRTVEKYNHSAVALSVTAEDVTRNGMTFTVPLNIKIVGGKDTAPVFSESIYKTHVSESTPVGSVLLTLKASDADEGDHLIYSAGGSGSEVIKVDMESGVVSLAQPLDFEKQQRFDIKVRATDSVQLAGEATLSIQVLDINDEPPRFAQPFAVADVADTALPGQFITIMSVSDEDTVASLPSGHGVLYSVIDGDDSMFNVDSQTGEVTLVRRIDDEDLISPEKFVNVSVSDGIFTAYGQLKVNIVVTGQRKPAPRFEQSQYVVGVRENMATENKSALLTIRAREGVPPLHYSLGGGKDNRAWPVKVASGKVFQRKSLSRKNTSSYQIPLIVEDQLGRRAFSTLTLNVIDQNDSEPKFTAKKYSCSVAASAKQSESLLMVSAVDEDDGDSLEYTLTDPSGLFHLHGRLGVLSLAGKIDRSVGTTYSMTVKATDIANPPHTATAAVEVTVVAAETPVPKFSNNHYLFNTVENSQVGTVIGKLQQVETAVEVVRYSIVESGEDLPIMIERSSGKLIVRGILDAEERDEWKFLVRADSPGGAHTMATVTVRVANIDDNAPVFHGSYTKQSISEDAPIGSSITVFSATDPDGSMNCGITYSLLENEDAVRMDAESGWLLVAGSLDREQRSFYDLTARATDEAGNSADMPFRLDVTDVNDEPPRFDQETYVVSVNPDTQKLGDPLLRMQVSDKDLPPFNTTRMFISRGNEEGIFAISEEGVLSVARLRFSPTVNFYNLTLLAFDGKHASTADVKVNVERSQPLTCPSDDLFLSVDENSALKTVIWETEDKTWHYQLISSEDLPFTIAKTGKLVVSGAMDAEKDTSFFFVLLMTSKGMECRRRVTVRVNDINDNAPVFKQKEYTVTVKENQAASAEVRFFVVRVHAEDKDSGELGKVRYSLADRHGAFTIDEKNGAITLVKPLDREEREQYTLHVLATDSDPVKAKTSKATVKVLVADQNDNPPLFEKKEYLAQVMESESVGYKLLTVKALGGDEGETVTYSLVEGTGNRFVKLDAASGDLTLAQPLDFEKEQQISVTVKATDSGKPPLSSETLVQIQVLDENDNVPIFSKNSYRTEIKENAQNGTVVLKVEATDADSEHYGRVQYSFVDQAVPFTINQTGFILVAGEIDREKVASYRLSAVARDGGNQTAQVTVVVEVQDENDNAPQFDVCNMTAVVQEGATPGHPILTIALRDSDGPQFAGPFSVSLKGEGHRSFLVDESLNIVTAARLDHGKKDKYLLTVIAKDKGGLSSDCPLTIYVKEESRHAPVVTPLRVTLNLLKGEFRGGPIGRISAKDQDSGDMLRYFLVDGSVQGPLSTLRAPQAGSHGRRPHNFKVSSENGEVWAEHSIVPGLHSMNVTVTDGKFNMVSYVEVEVVSLEQDALEHAVSIRILGITPEQFLEQHRDTFANVFAHYLNVRPENINLLSVQAAQGKRSRRSEPAVDVLFSVSRGIDGVDRGMLKPDHIYSRLKQDLFAVAHQSNLKYQLTTEVCTTGQCIRGECRERIDLSDQDLTNYSIDGSAFVAPVHSRHAECSCPEGFAGLRCEVEANACSRLPCSPHEMCAPSDDAPLGFECICPPGTSGEKCNKPACKNEGRCLEEAELSVSGNGFFDMSISNDVETRMELEVELRTVSTEGTILYGKGVVDYHLLEVNNGKLKYRWDAGSGEGMVKANGQVSDGKWHRVRISRRGRRTRLTLDDQETHESWSPAGAEVLNLQSSGLQLTFGAKVHRTNATSFSITDGVAACFRTISLDGRSLAKTRQGLRLQSASPGCRAMSATPCSEAPCKNGATCHAIGKKYSCLCPPRYQGDHCEIDREPCTDNPCPIGIQCIPFYNEFMCKCPHGFTGKRCHDRGFHQEEDDSCSSNPCGAEGECIVIPRQSMANAGFICNCTHGLSSSPCDVIAPTFFSRFSLVEIVVCAVILLLIALSVCGIIVLCQCIKRLRKDPKYGEHVTVPHMVNRHIAPQPMSAPPPLPPRGFRGNKLSNLEQAQLTGLPTIQVRPLPPHERFSGRGDSRSPSLVGSGKQWKKGSHEYGSAATEIDNMGTYDSKQLEALRRIGVRLDDETSSTGSGPSRVSRSDRRDCRRKESLEHLNPQRHQLGDSIQCLPTNDEPAGGWEDRMDGIGEAVRQERFRLEALTGRVHVGETVLSPLIDDNDYMTMRPRKATDSAVSQRRPLLDSVEPSGVESPAPAPPAHKKLYEDPSRVYDDPAYDCRKAVVCDIDASDTEYTAI